MQTGTVDDSSWENLRLPDPERPVIDFFQRHAERRSAKAWERGEQDLEEVPCPGGTDDGEWRTCSTLILGENHCVKEKGDEIGKMVRVKMGYQNVGDLISIHAGFDEVHQGARAKIQQNIVIRAHQIAGGGTARVHIGTGPKNGQLHSALIDTTTLRTGQDRSHTLSCSRMFRASIKSGLATCF